MKKKNKNRQRQKRKQAQALKNQRRRKEYLKSKVEFETIHWDNLNFLDGWKSLTPQALMDNVFKLDVDEWIDLYPKPKKGRDWNELQELDTVSEWLNETFNDSIKAWSTDTNGFTENLPERWQYTEKNQTLFLSMMKSELDEWNDEVELEVRELMENDRPEWFSVVFNDMIDDMVEVISPYIVSQIKVWLLG